ncbi:hypothetical protein DUI87_12817 [Hirundo rustica rustica]|uniref:Reverse transcriptase domain-containing protein n=1 Tax=Hirundo rustica rustica TaxID=333673 RepID=A0A3M0KA66_HIRRU|nr:hypothetical protein DUI87_12817 [Hirundo rustica rustica]
MEEDMDWRNKEDPIMTCIVDEGEAVDVAYLDFSKAFDTASCIILFKKLAAHNLDSHFFWVKNWVDGQAQRVAMNDVGGW